ncbi:centromere protein Q isoform X1 [Narcine bancroftii]|uniref:centromere protein Q isoform X1 n=1 Tax=Narcine bancroftii TaxID=1343680 RepID=UPI0038321F05
MAPKAGTVPRRCKGGVRKVCTSRARRRVAPGAKRRQVTSAISGPKSGRSQARCKRPACSARSRRKGGTSSSLRGYPSARCQARGKRPTSSTRSCRRGRMPSDPRRVHPLACCWASGKTPSSSSCRRAVTTHSGDKGGRPAASTRSCSRGAKAYTLLGPNGGHTASSAWSCKKGATPYIRSRTKNRRPTTSTQCGGRERASYTPDLLLLERERLFLPRDSERTIIGTLPHCPIVTGAESTGPDSSNANNSNNNCISGVLPGIPDPWGVHPRPSMTSLLDARWDPRSGSRAWVAFPRGGLFPWAPDPTWDSQRGSGAWLAIPGGGAFPCYPDLNWDPHRRSGAWLAYPRSLFHWDPDLSWNPRRESGSGGRSGLGWSEQEMVEPPRDVPPFGVSPKRDLHERNPRREMVKRARDLPFGGSSERELPWRDPSRESVELLRDLPHSRGFLERERQRDLPCSRVSPAREVPGRDPRRESMEHPGDFPPFREMVECTMNLPPFGTTLERGLPGRDPRRESMEHPRVSPPSVGSPEREHLRNIPQFRATVERECPWRDPGRESIEQPSDHSIGGTPERELPGRDPRRASIELILHHETEGPSTSRDTRGKNAAGPGNPAP